MNNTKHTLRSSLSNFVLIVNKRNTQFADSFLILKWAFKIEATGPCDIDMASSISHSFGLRSANSISWLFNFLDTATSIGRPEYFQPLAFVRPQRDSAITVLPLKWWVPLGTLLISGSLLLFFCCSLRATIELRIFVYLKHLGQYKISILFLIIIRTDVLCYVSKYSGIIFRIIAIIELPLSSLFSLWNVPFQLSKFEGNVFHIFNSHLQILGANFILV